MCEAQTGLRHISVLWWTAPPSNDRDFSGSNNGVSLGGAGENPCNLTSPPEWRVLYTTTFERTLEESQLRIVIPMNSKPYLRESGEPGISKGNTGLCKPVWAGGRIPQPEGWGYFTPAYAKGKGRNPPTGRLGIFHSSL